MVSFTRRYSVRRLGPVLWDVVAVRGQLSNWLVVGAAQQGLQMVSLTTEGFLMGGQYGKVGARIAVSSLLVTSLGLSVLAMAPVANVVEIPMC